ncbi:MAG: hypothetical protein R3F11_29975 [Verrucomicrobiales bacterium]
MPPTALACGFGRRRDSVWAMAVAAIFATVIIGIILLGALKRWWEG